MKPKEIMERPIQAMTRVVKKGTFKVEYVRKSEYGERGWAAMTEGGSNISPFGLYKTKAQMKDMLASRYLAEIFDDCAFINPRYVLRNPRWAHDKRGGLFEVAFAMRGEI